MSGCDVSFRINGGIVLRTGTTVVVVSSVVCGAEEEESPMGGQGKSEPWAEACIGGGVCSACEVGTVSVTSRSSEE